MKLPWLFLLSLGAASDSLLSPKGVNYDGNAVNLLVLGSSCCLCVFWLWLGSEVVEGVLSLVVALMGVRYKLKDELQVLGGWDINSADPCTWSLVGCSPEGFVVSL